MSPEQTRRMLRPEQYPDIDRTRSALTFAAAPLVRVADDLIGVPLFGEIASAAFRALANLIQTLDGHGASFAGGPGVHDDERVSGVLDWAASTYGETHPVTQAATRWVRAMHRLQAALPLGTEPRLRLFAGGRS